MPMIPRLATSTRVGVALRPGTLPSPSASAAEFRRFRWPWCCLQKPPSTARLPHRCPASPRYKQGPWSSLTGTEMAALEGVSWGDPSSESGSGKDASSEAGSGEAAPEESTRFSSSFSLPLSPWGSRLRPALTLRSRSIAQDILRRLEWIVVCARLFHVRSQGHRRSLPSAPDEAGALCRRDSPDRLGAGHRQHSLRRLSEPAIRRVLEQTSSRSGGPDHECRLADREGKRPQAGGRARARRFSQAPDRNPARVLNQREVPAVHRNRCSSAPGGTEIPDPGSRQSVFHHPGRV